MVDRIGVGIRGTDGKHAFLVERFTSSAFTRHLALVGRRGHTATFDTLTGNVHSELQLKETCRDITYVCYHLLHLTLY